MKSIRDLVGRELKWVQPQAMHSNYELRDGDEVVATLGFRNGFGTLATFESADGCHTFKRVSFWQPKVTIRQCDTTQDIAEFKNSTWTYGGTLHFPDGRKFPANTNFWSTQYEFKTETDVPLIKYRNIGGVLHLSSLVAIQPAAADLAELFWLVGLGWYLTVMMYRDSASVAATTTATA